MKIADLPLKLIALQIMTVGINKGFSKDIF